jgi:hypothetical protein
MQAIKRSYVDLVQATGRSNIVQRFFQSARGAPQFGYKRWLASLFAIYDTENMVALDLPWWNVEATREVELFLSNRSGAKVFETGAGASTVWLSRRAAQVVSVEHDEAWHGRFLKMIAGISNIDLRFRSLGDAGQDDSYVSSIDESTTTYDLIVVDGRHRVACLQRAIAHLAPDGLILFDDSGRSRYRGGIEGCGLVERRHFGRSFCVPYPDYTSLLHRDAM